MGSNEAQSEQTNEQGFLLYFHCTSSETMNDNIQLKLNNDDDYEATRWGRKARILFIENDFQYCTLILDHRRMKKTLKWKRFNDAEQVHIINQWIIDTERNEKRFVSHVWSKSQWVSSAKVISCLPWELFLFANFISVVSLQLTTQKNDKIWQTRVWHLFLLSSFFRGRQR